MKKEVATFFSMWFFFLGGGGNPSLTQQGIYIFMWCCHLVTKCGCSDLIPLCPWCILGTVTLIFTAVYLESDCPSKHVSLKCEKSPKERLQAVLSGDNTIIPAVPLRLLEIISSQFRRQTEGILILVAGFSPAATVAGTAAHQGACQVLALRVSLW